MFIRGDVWDTLNTRTYPGPFALPTSVIAEGRNQTMPSLEVHPIPARAMGHFVRCLGWDNLCLPLSAVSTAITRSLAALEAPYEVVAQSDGLGFAFVVDGLQLAHASRLCVSITVHAAEHGCTSRHHVGLRRIMGECWQLKTFYAAFRKAFSANLGFANAAAGQEAQLARQQSDSGSMLERAGTVLCRTSDATAVAGRRERCDSELQRRRRPFSQCGLPRHRHGRRARRAGRGKCRGDGMRCAEQAAVALQRRSCGLAIAGRCEPARRRSVSATMPSPLASATALSDAREGSSLSRGACAHAHGG